MWKGLMGGACGRSSFEWFVWEGLVGGACGSSFERFMWKGLVGGALWEKLFERFMWEGLIWVGLVCRGGACGRGSREGLVGEFTTVASLPM